MNQPLTPPAALPVKIIVPTGSLGSGAVAEEIAYGISQGAHAIATDAGSTDSGAAYLALGVAKHGKGTVKRDLRLMMEAGSRARIPVIVGTSGQAGGDMNVDWLLGIALEIAQELAITPRIAVLYSEQDKQALKSSNARGRIHPLPPSGALTDETIDACAHIVAAMGPEPYMQALRDGADVILGGRTTDTAVLACMPLLRGAPPGPAWHAGKIAECGALCCAVRNAGSGVLLSIDAEGFTVEPLGPANRCTPASVSAHMLYENSDPFLLTEPGGVLDVTHATYTAIDERKVRVTGSVWHPKPYTMKLEGAAVGRYQTLMLIGIQDPAVLARIDEFHDRMLEALNARVHRTMDEAAGDFHISLRIYGWNAVSGGRPPPGTPAPREVGVLFVATARTQQIASQIAKTCNGMFFHFPVDMNKELPSYSFAFSPADVDRGPVYEFRLNHVIDTQDPMELVRTRWVQPQSKEAA